MIVLKDDQLPVFVDQLEKEFPASLNIYFLARNKMRNYLAWPGISFVVDSFPNYSACIARTDPDDPNVPPFVNGYSIFIHATDPAKLKTLLDQPNIIDWDKKIGVHNMQKPGNFQVMADRCQTLGCRIAFSDSDYFVEDAFFVGFHLNKIPQLKYTLPAGFRVGTLEEEHAEQLTREKHFGDLEDNLRYFKYVLHERFPSVGLFNEKNELIAYCFQRPEGVVGAGYVVPEYRAKGFGKIGLYELLQELGRRGETLTYGDITTGNAASLGVCLSVGGFVYPDYKTSWFEVIPKTAVEVNN